MCLGPIFENGIATTIEHYSLLKKRPWKRTAAITFSMTKPSRKSKTSSLLSEMNTEQIWFTAKEAAEYLLLKGFILYTAPVYAL